MTHSIITYFGKDRTVESSLKECAEVGEEVVKFLCGLSLYPGDEPDMLAMKLGGACDLAGAFASDLSEPSNTRPGNADAAI